MVSIANRPKADTSTAEIPLEYGQSACNQPPGGAQEAALVTSDQSQGKCRRATLRIICHAGQTWAGSAGGTYGSVCCPLARELGCKSELAAAGQSTATCCGRRRAATRASGSESFAECWHLQMEPPDDAPMEISYSDIVLCIEFILSVLWLKNNVTKNTTTDKKRQTPLARVHH